MTERDSDSGQFTSEAPAFGLEGIERDAGYVPYKEEGAESEPEELTVAEAAEELTQERAGTSEANIKTYSALDDLPDNATLTIDQAAKIMSDDRDADERAAADVEAERIRKEDDELRGEKKAEKAKELPAQEQPSPDPSNLDIDPELERALNNPRVAEVLSTRLGEAEQSRQQYAAGLEAATTIVQHAFVAQFSEFANVPEEQRGDVLRALQHQNPARFNQVYNAVVNTQRLFQAQAQEQQRQEHTKRAAFTSYAQAEDAKFAGMVKGETQMPEIQREIINAMEEYGVDPKQFFERYAVAHRTRAVRPRPGGAAMSKAARPKTVAPVSLAGS